MRKTLALVAAMLVPSSLEASVQHELFIEELCPSECVVSVKYDNSSLKDWMMAHIKAEYRLKKDCDSTDETIRYFNFKKVTAGYDIRYCSEEQAVDILTE
ncbi:MAG: hypothetical protein CMH61_03035 [Nanoarchaeota archaeon]|nr:hypothetical protein [Nanoarchaeota archaeon]|tara:strand:+ start:7077 stop:7376 length:300 start_codon:yes stop_codon:yes gene_type:complete